MGRQASWKKNEPAGNAAPDARADVRIDPHALPQCFRLQTGLSGEAAEALVTLDRSLAIVNRRMPSGLPMAMRLPIDQFEGVAVRMVSAADAEDITIVIELLHRDPLLSLPVSVTTSMDDVIADWRAWGRIMGLPLLIVEQDGSFKPVETRLGCVTVKPVLPRRRRSIVAKRRPRFLARRRVGAASAARQLPPAREITSWE